ncbi:transcriptional regulator family: Fungal Specific TF [Penicillium roqueforti]|uniref:Zn(2)-C6 fungal-type DNA-binding domain n=1 Tax=Penicillium roqueforti (strain FM164) TaxID=1365484 RepID=W6QB37_PENRF|nr:transcriptional regulator family: Fungal Specific TF [Penicillium roqueforti]CDM33680.1 Zn(2)-C6 fungal-type DNA-binding domain [Penicillium roqueforti FM164]KAF9248752.1 transcriptional regulator family: Fungal Specific TF [Penicillium roqueforti]KAI1831628.1 transcriptional regulator family: Fungal Specific TF [Penicillium roqueforti]KAI2689083.1 transcriptional regulator family: Fungal Specific TF [Penicillium roqueforti]KAI2712671.1 transcriptional regulator family: Fungal Specific TF [
MDIELPSPPPVSALRESFGDRKPPDITRKITACVACRKQKVKCHMGEGQMPCSRCKKRGLPCSVNRSLQTLLEDDVTWKGAVVQKMRRLEEAVAKIAAKVDMPEFQALQTVQAAPEIQDNSLSPPVETINEKVIAGEISTSSQPSQPNEHHEPPQTWEVIMDPRGGPASIPASCVSESGKAGLPNNPSTSRRPDLISTGLILLRDAVSLFETYHLRLDHFLYRILGDHISLDSVRIASPLLTAAVCTVAALHSHSLGHLFETCYGEYKNVVAAQTFSRHMNEDDIRGLCVGAFWLHELSWALIGNAVRIASDINLHSGIYKALKGDRDGYLQARLYYLVYVCDHHFSIAYGRPPMSREGFIIESASRILETEHATEDDARLISQVKEWSILGRVFDTFGVDVDTPIAPQTLPQLRRCSISLDTWFADWSESFKANQNVGNYPQKGVGFHYHFAKLYLCSHAFRGVPISESSPQYMSPELEEIANSGVLSAMSILRMIVSDAEFRSFMNGLPLYFDTMLAFAVVFLLKVATKYAFMVRIDTTKILSLVTDTVAALRDITQSMHKHHLLVVISEGLERLSSRCQMSAHTAHETMYRTSPAQEQPPVFDAIWMENMASFDFQTIFPDIDDWWLHYNTSMEPPL